MYLLLFPQHLTLTIHIPSSQVPHHGVEYQTVDNQEICHS